MSSRNTFCISFNGVGICPHSFLLSTICVTLHKFSRYKNHRCSNKTTSSSLNTLYTMFICFCSTNFELLVPQFKILAPNCIEEGRVPSLFNGVFHETFD